MQCQGHNRTHHEQDLATMLFSTAQHLPFTRDAGKVHSPSLPHVPGAGDHCTLGTRQAGCHHAKRQSTGTGIQLGRGDFLVQLALAHRCGGLGGEGLQGLSLPTVALGCSGDTAPVPFPPSCPSLHCCDKRHPKPTGPFAAPGEPLVSLHNSWQGRLKGNSSSPGDPQACQDGGKLSAGQDTGSSLHQRAKSWTNLEGNSSKDIKQPQNRSPVPSLTTRSLPRLWVTLPQAATTSPTSSHSLYPAPCKLPHPMPPQLPGHLGLEEPCLLPHCWGTLRGLLSSHHPETTASALLLISSAFGRASCCPAAGVTRTRASHVLLDIPAQHYSGSSC